MNNSFNFLLIIFSERLEKISDIRRNIQQSIVVLLSAMDRMKIPLHNKDNELSRDFIMKEAGNPESHRRNVSITVQFVLVVLLFSKTFLIHFVDFTDNACLIQEFLDHVEQLWNDAGVQECYGKSHGFQLIDCAK